MRNSRLKKEEERGNEEYQTKERRRGVMRNIRLKEGGEG